MNGAEHLVHTLLAQGVEVCFANPGTSEMHFVAALDRVAGMRCVLGLFEGVVTGAADGYWRMADRPACTLLHLGPGLANGLANLHNAKKARSGIVNVVGEHAIGHIALDAPLTSDIEGLARPMSHWVATASGPDDVGRLGAEAVAVARTPPGRIATMVLPADAAWGLCSAAAARARPVLPGGSPSGEAAGAAMAAVAGRAARAGADPMGADAGAGVAAPRAVSEDAVAAAVKALRSGTPALLLLAGRALRADALDLAGRIAAKTGCRLMSEFYVARLERGAGRVVAPRIPYVVDAAMAALAPFAHIVLVGATPPVAFFAYPGKPGRLAPASATFTTLAGPEDDLPGALEALADALGARTLAPAGVAGAVSQANAAAVAGPSGVRAGSRPEAPADGPLTLEGIARVIAAQIPEGAIVVDEAITSGRAFGAATVGAAPHDWLTAMGGSIGFGLPVAIGAAIGAPGRKVLVLEGDGSAMYTVQSLWTMARERLDVTVLIFANRSYQILRGELAGVGAGTPGARATDMLTLDRPALDWVALARGMGVEASRAVDLGALHAQLRDAVAGRGPRLIELVL